MEVVGICRCCLAQGLNKDLHSSYLWLDKKENYADMLQQCFSITLTSNGNKAAGICDNCIKTLRTSVTFKQQVLHADEEFQKLLQNVDKEDPKMIKIKIEPGGDSGDDSDDYYLADTASVQNSTPPKVKNEKEPVKKKAEPKRTRQKAVKKSSEEEKAWKNEKIKTLVSRLATSIKSCDMPDMKKPAKKTEVKPKKTRLKLTIPSADSKINLLWTGQPHHEKLKHKENLQTILKFSNATPFTNKTLLGYSCGYCDLSYPDPADLRHHTETSHQKERLNFKANFDMSEYNVKVDVTDLTCSLCEEKMDSVGIFKEHLVKQHSKTIYNDIKDHILQFKLKKGEVYDCAMCPSTYETFKMLKQHMNKHYSNYTCSICDTSFATKRSLTAHRTTHEEGSFKCDHCEKVFPSRTKKHYHEKMKHLGARNISNCPYCNVPFRSYYQRNQHLVKVHNNEAQYKCNVCNKAYILKSLLMYHIKKSHLMERNCQCTECGYRFFSKKALKAHMVKHTGERIYSCEVCQKSYARKYTLREHMRIHNNDRRFKCEVCNMTFVQKCSLKSHLLSNHGISVAASEIIQKT
ncbi:zinc finger protein 431-like [Helicoverpa zea]|uniref:zinc finger protein 431-like n=1 Tax=Helicoverpa zea TaxID=7113 RepID=UPI001F564C88|nr:zinc finger protein 431-like [Helicoverpa zea]